MDGMDGMGGMDGDGDGDEMDGTDGAPCGWSEACAIPLLEKGGTFPILPQCLFEDLPWFLLTQG